MSFPNIPTDKLYKFMTVIGGLIFFLSFYHPKQENFKLLKEFNVITYSFKKSLIEHESSIGELSEMVDEYTIEGEIYGLESDYIISKVLDDLTLTLNSTSKLDEERAELLLEEIETFRKELMERDDPINEKLDEIDKKGSELEMYARQAETILNQMVYNDMLAYYGSRIGLIIAFIGIFFWIKMENYCWKKIKTQKKKV